MYSPQWICRAHVTHSIKATNRIWQANPRGRRVRQYISISLKLFLWWTHEGKLRGSHLSSRHRTCFTSSLGVARSSVGSRFNNDDINSISNEYTDSNDSNKVIIVIKLIQLMMNFLKKTSLQWLRVIMVRRCFRRKWSCLSNRSYTLSSALDMDTN